jgi:hypothetical protein
MVTDPRVVESHQTWEGQLLDGRVFYFRYRWGFASLGVGSTLDDAVSDNRVGRQFGDRLDGWLDEDEFEVIFKELLDLRQAQDAYPHTNHVHMSVEDWHEVPPYRGELDWPEDPDPGD